MPGLVLLDTEITETPQGLQIGIMRTRVEMAEIGAPVFHESVVFRIDNIIAIVTLTTSDDSREQVEPAFADIIDSIEIIDQ